MVYETGKTEKKRNVRNHSCKINHLREQSKRAGEKQGVSLKGSLVLVHQQATSPEELSVIPE